MVTAQSVSPPSPRSSFADRSSPDEQPPLDHCQQQPSVQLRPHSDDHADKTTLHRPSRQHTSDGTLVRICHTWQSIRVNSTTYTQCKWAAHPEHSAVAHHPSPSSIRLRPEIEPDTGPLSSLRSDPNGSDRL